MIVRRTRVHDKHELARIGFSKVLSIVCCARIAAPSVRNQTKKKSFRRNSITIFFFAHLLRAHSRHIQYTRSFVFNPPSSCGQSSSQPRASRLTTLSNRYAIVCDKFRHRTMHVPSKRSATMCPKLLSL